MYHTNLFVHKLLQAKEHSQMYEACVGTEVKHPML